MATRSSRTSEDAFVTNDRDVPSTNASTASVIHSLEEVLRRHRDKMSKSKTANISVKEAFRTRGDEAKKVIVSELKQMINKRVWVPVMGGEAISDAESNYNQVLNVPEAEEQPERKLPQAQS